MEKFSQLYDNEWTNACEVLKKIEGFEDDKAAVKLLLDIVMVGIRVVQINMQIFISVNV